MTDSQTLLYYTLVVKATTIEAGPLRAIDLYTLKTAFESIEIASEPLRNR